MAQLPQTQSFRAQVNQAPSAVAPGVSFGQQRPELAYEAQAQYQGTVSKVLDRLTSTIFGVAQDQSQRAGLQFSAENPLTATQLKAMATGDVSELDLGNPLNVFNNAVRKARAIELSAHAEIEGRDKLVELLKKAESGEIDTGAIRDHVAAITNGYGEALAQIEPEASYKYRATMATIGSKVIDKVAELEGKKRLIANRTKLDRLYQNMQKEVSLYASSEPPLDPKTGQPMPLDMVTDSLKQNFLNNAQTLGGLNAVDVYIARIDKDITDAKINSVTQVLITDENFGKPGTLDALRVGNAGKATAAYMSLLPEDRAKVMANYMTAISNRRNEMETVKAADKLAAEGTANNLLIEFYNPSTNQTRRRQIGNELAGLKVLSVDQMERFLNPKVEGDAYAYADLETAIVTNQITDSAELRKLAARSGMNGEQYARLNTKLLSGLSKDETSAFKIMQNAAGLPDVIGVRTKDDQHMFDKRRVLNQRFELAKSDKLKKGEAFDPVALAYEVIDNYNKVDGANVKKNQAQRKLDNVVKDIRARKNMPDSFTIDSTTNLDDLLSRKIIDNDQYEYLKTQQRILREVTQ
jgi:hypothetical protein